MAPARSFRPADLLREVQIGEPTLSPDGSSVVYARRTIEDGEYRKRLWRVPYEGGRPELLTAGPNDSRPRFSPDGRALLFLSDRSGRSQPWLLPLGGGEPTLLAEPLEDVSAAEWSPDASTVALLAPSGEERFLVGPRERALARRVTDLTWRFDGVGVRDMYSSLWTVPAAGGRPTRLTSGFEVGNPFWSADSKRLGFVADLGPEAALAEWPQAWALPAGGGRPALLAELDGFVASASWSARGRLSLLGSPARTVFTRLDPFVVERRRPRALATDLDRPCAFLVSGDSVDPAARVPPPLHWIGEQALLTLVTTGGSCVPYLLRLDGSTERLVEADAVCGWLASVGARTVVTASVDSRPAEAYAVEDGRLRPLTRDGSRWHRPFHREPERVLVRRRGRPPVEAWLLRPNGRRRKRPLVLHVHGGPHLAHGPLPWLEMLALADAGIGVLWGNPRGSVGYGEAFASAIEGNWGQADSADLLRLLDWAVAEGHAEPGRIGLLGLSYGGYMTAWLLGQHPGRFAAGVCENPVADLASFFGESDYGFLGPTSGAGIEEPWQDPERLLDRSPIARIHRNEAPLLLLQAEADLRCPPGQTDVLFTTLRRLGRPVEMVRYPEESHLLLAIGRPDRRVDRIERIVDWFERHLLTGA